MKRDIWNVAVSMCLFLSIHGSLVLAKDNSLDDVSKRGYGVWTETSMVRIFGDTRPQSFPKEPVANISLAGGEYESFQIVVLPILGNDLKDVKVELTDLVCGTKKITANNIQWHQVGYVYLEYPSNHPLCNGITPGWWPDPLLKVTSFSVKNNWAQPIWVTVYAPPGTSPGEYSGMITITVKDKESTKVQIKATAYGFSIAPGAGHMKTAFCLMDGFLAKLYGKPLSQEIRRQYGEFVLQYRLNPDDISRTEPPNLEDLLYYQRLGMNSFNVCNLAQVPQGDAYWTCFSPPEWYTEENKQKMMAKLNPFFEALSKHEDLKKMAYVHGFDERGLEDYGKIIKEWFNMVQSRWDVPTLTTSRVKQDPKEMTKYHVNWICPIIFSADTCYKYDFESAEYGRSCKGLQVWAYTSCSTRYPNPNFFVDFPLIESRVMWWLAYQQKMDGFLFWAINYWEKKPNNDHLIDPVKDGPFLKWTMTFTDNNEVLKDFYGDGTLIYPGVNGPIGTIRLANIRDGLEDYEYIWMLSNQAGDIEVGRKACNPVVYDIKDFSRNPETIYNQRNAIAVKLENNQNKKSH